MGQYSSFSGKMVLKRPFLNDTGEASALHLDCSGFPGDRTLIQYDSLSENMVLKWLFIDDTGEASSYSLFLSQ